MTLRQRSRELFPNWSRRQRAKWVVLRARIKEPRVDISVLNCDDYRLYAFARSSRYQS